MPDVELKRLRAEQKAKARRPKLVDKMRANGIIDVGVIFGGWCDANKIDQIFVTPTGINLPNGFEKWIYKFLEGTGVGWQGEDQGFGTIDFDLVQNRFLYEINRRTVEVERVASGDEEL